MQRTTLLLVAFYCCPYNGTAQPDALLKKTVKKFEISYRDGKASEPELQWIDTYDIRGNMIGQIIYQLGSSDCGKEYSKFSSYTTAKYDRWGEVTQKTTFLCNTQHPYKKSTYTYKRNSKGQLLEMKTKTTTYFNSSEKPLIETSSEKYTYNERGQYQRVYQSFGQYLLYTYDHNGNCNYIFARNNFTKKPNVSNFKYDRNNNCISYQFKGDKICGLTITSWQKKYNKSNQLVYSKKSSSVANCESEYTYNDEGQLIKKVSKPFLYKYIYNSNGDLAERQTYSSGEKIPWRVSYYTYTYH